MLGNPQKDICDNKNRLASRVALYLCLFVCALMSTPLSALSVNDIEIESLQKEERISVALSRPVHYKAFLLDGPPRMVVDLPKFQWRVDANKIKQYHGSLIKNVRYARFNAETSRVVFDLSAPVTLQTSTPPNELVSRIIFYLVPQSAKELERSEQNTSWKMRDPVFGKTPLPQQKPAQLKEKKPLIVIDAGHGGNDPGASGRYRTKEKHVTLRYAQALRDALESSGRFKVLLTRGNDRYIRLRERFAIARRAEADLFISLHADSAPNIKARGLSVYTLSEDASDAEAEALAERENKSDIIAGVDLNTDDEELAGILIDLVKRDTKNKSIGLAERLVASARRENVKLLPNTHRFAGFAVLKAPDIPSALVEIGFLSNPEEEKLINTPAYREKVTQGLANGITSFLEQYTSNKIASNASANR